MVSGRRGGRVAWAAALLILAAAGWLAWRAVSGAGVAVTVTVDGYSETLRSARPTVGALLTDLGLHLRAEDRLAPPVETPLTADLAVTIRRARPGVIEADGASYAVYSHALTVGDLLAEAGLRLVARDEVWLDGVQANLGTALPLPDRVAAAGRLVSFARGRAWSAHAPQAVQLSVRRAAPVVVRDGGISYTIYTTAETVGQALLREQVTLYLGDQVQPGLGSRVVAGLHVEIGRSKPVLVTVDRRTVRTRTRGETVGDTLVELGLIVAGSDRVSPPLTQRVGDNTQIRVVRVLETVLVEGEPIPFIAELVPDDNLEIDRQRLDQAGEVGEYRRRFKVVFEDRAEVSRILTDDWVAAEPITQVVAYGRKVVSRPLETPDGAFSYWRVTRMLATSYSASTAGVSPSAPWYGITRLGLRMRKGIVAVDAGIIPLGSQVYVPGYGLGDAADTGSAIRARQIDLGYDDDNLVLWYRWVDVYWLDPPPPAWQIRWVLPNWPRE